MISDKRDTPLINNTTCSNQISTVAVLNKVFKDTGDNISDGMTDWVHKCHVKKRKVRLTHLDNDSDYESDYEPVNIEEKYVDSSKLEPDDQSSRGVNEPEIKSENTSNVITDKVLADSQSNSSLSRSRRQGKITSQKQLKICFKKLVNYKEIPKVENRLAAERRLNHRQNPYVYRSDIEKSQIGSK